MHFISELRYNPKTQCDEFYYRIKESFRDLTSRCRSRIMLNICFIEEPHRPEDIRDIGKCLDYYNLIREIECTNTTEAINALGNKVKLRLCSEPTQAADDIYRRLKYKKMPFRRKTL